MQLKALVIDFSRVLIFANAAVSSLNHHHDVLELQPGYRVLDHFQLNIELLDYLRELGKRLPVYLFSDGRLHTLPEISPSLDGIFKKIMTAKEVGYKKSEAEAFLGLAYRLGYAPQELLFVDDQAANIAAAKSAGFAAHRYIANSELIDFLRDTLPAFSPDV